MNKNPSSSSLAHAFIAGGGTLGSRIGFQCALSGMQTVIFDVAEKGLEAARRVHDKVGRRLVRDGQYHDVEVEEARARIIFTTELEAISTCDFISESVTEDVAVKRKFWEAAGKLANPEALLTTNTSYLLPSMFADVLPNPERFCAYHFHDVFHANVVDIMPHPGTAPWVSQVLISLAPRLNQIPIFVQSENPGYVFNAMLVEILGSASKLLVNGVASVEDIDRSWMGNFKMDIGPFGIYDTIGLETAWHVTKGFNNPGSKQFCEVLESYIKAGKLGVKSGEGFYKYPNPAFKLPDFLGS